MCLLWRPNIFAGRRKPLRPVEASQAKQTIPPFSCYHAVIAATREKGGS